VFLRSELAHAQVLPASSTAEAVRTVVNDRTSPGGGHRAALGTLLAARIYGGTVLREGVQDRDDNETRFAWLARSPEDADGGRAERPPLRPSGSEEWKTSLVFWGPGAAHAGWLVRCLDEFARREINLTKIESRPRPGRLGSYMFFADLEGSPSETAVAEAITGLRALCEQVRVLGAYRVARDPQARAG
jgi:prephenate dehydratase